MYRIETDGITLYEPRLPEYCIIEGRLTQELNTAGTLTIKLPESNPSYGLPRLMRSIITLYDDDVLVFRGRPYAPTVDLFKDNVLECEGELAFLNDTYQQPFDYYGTVAGLFTQVLEAHNAQVSAENQFLPGRITVVNSTEQGNISRSSEEYLTTWELIKDKFIGSNLGGYLWVRHEDDGNYLDYVTDLNYLGDQKVEQTINLLSATQKTTSDDLATVIVPIGAKVTETDEETGDTTEYYVTIESVNDGKDYIEDAEGIGIYGRIVKITHHDDITEPSNLLLAARADLGAALGVTTTLTLTAADLSKAGYEVSPFSLGTYAHVNVENLGVNDYMLIRALNIDLLNPGANNLTIGSTAKSLTGGLLTTSQVQQMVTRDIRTATSGVSNQILTQVSSTIEQNTENIYTEVAKSYYSAASGQTLESQVSSINQTASAISFDFNTFKTNQENTNDANAQEFSDIHKYIRFEDGDIILGVDGNPLTLRIENDRITFLENGGQIAYWQNRKFYAVDGEFINSLRLGKFAFIPRPTDNLSFKKVID